MHLSEELYRMLCVILGLVVQEQNNVENSKPSSAISDIVNCYYV